MRKTFLALSMAVLLTILMLSGAQGKKVVMAQGGTGTPDASGETCSRTVNNLVSLLKRDYQFTAETKPGDADYCSKLEEEANAFAEKQLTGASSAEGLDGESQGAFAFLDAAAKQYVGSLPKGSPFKAMGRNATPGSQMMYVTGDNFAVFVDYTFTTVQFADFQKLPDVTTLEVKAYCGQTWCRNPGPPPTKAK